VIREAAFALAACLTPIVASDARPEFRRPAQPTQPHALVRETDTVVVGSVSEEWQLVWRSTPSPLCAPDDSSWSTMPCTGIAFGEAGTLDLIRIRNGAIIERLPLTPLFDSEYPGFGRAVLRRWPVLDSDSDFAVGGQFALRVRARRPARAMRIADYDHDGWATEFPLQVGSYPVVWPAILVGVSRRRPHLHAFGTAQHPHAPLTLADPEQWEDFLHSSGDTTLVQVGCGNHGSEEQTEIALRATPAGLVATEFTYACDRHGDRGQLVHRRRL